MALIHAKGSVVPLFEEDVRKARIFIPLINQKSFFMPYDIIVSTFPANTIRWHDGTDQVVTLFEDVRKAGSFITPSIKEIEIS